MNKYAVATMVSLALAGIAQGAAAEYPAAGAGGPASPWYIGAGFGKTDASIPSNTLNQISSQLSSVNGATLTVFDKDERSTGAKVFVGFTFNRHFAVEGGYAVLGETSVNMDFRAGSPSATVDTFDLQYKMTAAFIDAVGMLPLNEHWSLIGRAGVAYGRTSATFGATQFTIVLPASDKSETKVREKFGAGIDYNLNREFTIRGEWERYKMPDPLSDDLFNVDTATVSLLYRF